MKFVHSSILGLAIGDHEVRCAQISQSGKRRLVQRLGTFVLPNGASTMAGLAQAQKLGELLRAFLREHGMNASRAVIGVPAKWLLAQDREVPPTDENAGLAILRMQAERLSVSDNHEMIFDVAGSFDSARPTRVLLMGILKQRVQQLAQMCEAAGLNLMAIAPSAIVVSQVLGQGGESPMIVYSGKGAELIFKAASGATLLRHLSAAEAVGGTVSGLATLAGELKRTFALNPPGGDSSRKLLLLNEPHLEAHEIRALSEAVGLSVQTDHSFRSMDADVDPKALNGAAGHVTAEAFLPAAALAVVGFDRRTRIVDFLHPRLAPPRERQISQKVTLSVGAAVLAILLLTWLYLDVRKTESEALVAEGKVVSITPQSKTAKTVLSRLEYGREYFDERPPVPQALVHVTKSLRPGEPIWMTNFQLREVPKGNQLFVSSETVPEREWRGFITGNATNQDIVLTVVNRLRQDPMFLTAQMTEYRQSVGVTQGNVTFSIQFTFLPTYKDPDAPALTSAPATPAKPGMKNPAPPAPAPAPAVIEGEGN